MIKQIRAYYWRKKALYKIKKNCYKDIEVDNIQIDWITTCIIERKQEFRRKELVEAQAKLKEDELFLKWLLQQK